MNDLLLSEPLTTLRTIFRATFLRLFHAKFLATFLTRFLAIFLARFLLHGFKWLHVKENGAAH